MLAIFNVGDLIWSLKMTAHPVLHVKLDRMKLCWFQLTYTWHFHSSQICTSLTYCWLISGILLLYIQSSSFICLHRLEEQTVTRDFCQINNYVPFCRLFVIHYLSGTKVLVIKTFVGNNLDYTAYPGYCIEPDQLPIAYERYFCWIPFWRFVIFSFWFYCQSGML